MRWILFDVDVNHVHDHDDDDDDYYYYRFNVNVKAPINIGSVEGTVHWDFWIYFYISLWFLGIFIFIITKICSLTVKLLLKEPSSRILYSVSIFL